MAGRVLLILLFLGGVLLGCGAATASAQVKGPVRLSMEVPSGKVKTLRLRNLPQNAAVAVQVRTSGEVMVAFLDTADFKRFPQVVRPLFTGRVEKQILFSLKMPEAGDYYVVLDNRLGQEPRKVTLTIRAARGQPKGEGGERLSWSYPGIAPWPVAGARCSPDPRGPSTECTSVTDICSRTATLLSG